MRFIRGGGHHTDEVHLGRRAPRGRGSSGEESTTQTRFIWGGEHHVDEVRLGRRAPRGRGSSGEESTTWTRFVWGGEHHVDEVHLGRRAPRGQGSSGEESTTWTRFIWGGGHHVDEVHLGRRGREVDSLANLNYQGRICVTPPTCADDGVTPLSVVMVMSSSGCSVSMAYCVPTPTV